MSILGGLQRGRGRRGFNNIYTLNIVPYHQKCFLFVCSSYRGLKKNIISCQRYSNACTAWWFLLRNILVIFCCVQDSVHGLLNENGNIPRPLSPEGVVWVSETSFDQKLKKKIGRKRIVSKKFAKIRILIV